MIETKMVEYGYLIEKTLCVTTAATSFVAFPVAGPSFFLSLCIHMQGSTYPILNKCARRLKLNKCERVTLCDLQRLKSTHCDHLQYTCILKYSTPHVMIDIPYKFYSTTWSREC
jgi:hypothetical protein